MTSERGWIIRVRNLRTDQWEDIMTEPLGNLRAVQSLVVEILTTRTGAPVFPIDLLGGLDFVEVEQRPSFDGPPKWVPVRELQDPAGYPVAEEG